MFLLAGIPFLDSLASNWLVHITPTGAMHGFMWGSIGITALVSAVLYCITIRMLHRHLNLE